MPYTLNGEPLAPGRSFTIEDTNYTGAELIHWPRADLLALPGMAWVEPEPVVLTVEQLCDAIDRERDRRLAEDFVFDFGATIALDDNGNEIAAGVRHLQMRPLDVSNWLALYSVATVAVMNGQGATVMPMRAEDNWNIQTTAAEVLEVLSAAFARGSVLTMAGGAIKSQQRAVYPEVVDVMVGWP